MELEVNQLTGYRNPIFLRTLAQAYLRAGDSARATQVWEQAFDLILDNRSRASALGHSAWDLLNVTPAALRDPTAALRFAQRANELTDYENPVYLGALATAYLLTGEPGRAVQAWEQAAALSADDASRARLLNSAAWRLLTVTPEGFRDPVRALDLALKANDLGGYENPPQLDTLALALHRTGQTTRAIELQKKALGLLAADAPDRAEYEGRLAELERALGP